VRKKERTVGDNMSKVAKLLLSGKGTKRRSLKKN